MMKTCQECQVGFEVNSGDLAFYDKVSPIFNGKKYLIPEPKLCPDCRRQRRLAWRNERNLYQRPCDLCKKTTITVHAPDHPYPVYCNPCWWGNNWDALSFGLTYDSKRPFMEQYYRLLSQTPQRAMVNDDGVMSKNCAYTFDVAFSKDCYLCFGMWKAENCYYCRICDQSKFSVDCEDVKLGSELNYECIDSQKLYRCRYLQNSENCHDCWFGFDLKGCQDCIGCVGLRQKRFYIFNQPFSEEEYKKHLANFRLSSRSGLKTVSVPFDKFIKSFPRKNMNLQNCENCVGDHLFNCKEVTGYVCTNSQYSKWVDRSDAPVWSYDQVQSGSPELCYECVTVDNGYMARFALYTNQTRFSLYTDNCISCEQIFGCVSLRRKKFCILNQQYAQNEYEKLVEQIITSMQYDGTWGEFFDIKNSIYGYNETNAAEFFPLTEAEVKQKGWRWSKKLPHTTGKETIKLIPEDIHDVPDSIIKEILACVTCQKNYRIIHEELDFYRKLSIPLPDRCPDCRNQERLKRRNPQKIWQRNCSKCSSPIQTTYSPDRPEIVYCESCYLKEVY